MKLIFGAAALSAALCLGQTASAVTYNEATSGDAGNSFDSPTPLGLLGPGTHTLSGSVSCSRELTGVAYFCSSADDPFDYFRFDIGSGTTLSGLEIETSNFSSTNEFSQAVYRLFKNDLSTVVIDYVTGDGQPGNLLGSGQGPDSYTLQLRESTSLFEQSSLSFDYTATLTVDGPTPNPIPLPASAILLAGALGGLGALRRTRKQAAGSR